MAVIRDRITVIPPSGETVTVDISEGGASLGTVHAERTTARTLTLPLSITDRTSFFVPVGGTYEVSVLLDGVEIAGDDASPVTVSSFPAEIRTAIDVTEMTDVVSGGSSAVTPILVTLARTMNDNNPAVTAPLPDGQMIVAVPGIPGVLAAGGSFEVIVQNTSDVDIKVVGGDVSSLYVGNTDASEYVSVVVGTDLLVAAGATVSVVFDDGAVMQTGSDLSQNGALTNVVSAAGGTFSALANLVIEPA